MADKKVSAKPKRRSKRLYIKFYVTEEQKAQIQREVPDREVGQYCRDRIFHPSGLRDPVVDVGARLLAMAARHKRFDVLLVALQKRINDDLAAARNFEDDDPEHALLGLLAKGRHEDVLALIEDARSTTSAILKEARDMCRLIALRQERSSSIPLIEKRKDGR